MNISTMVSVRANERNKREGSDDVNAIVAKSCFFFAEVDRSGLGAPFSCCFVFVLRSLCLSSRPALFLYVIRLLRGLRPLGAPAAQNMNCLQFMFYSFLVY